MLAPSVLPHWWQEEGMAELCLELASGADWCWFGPILKVGDAPEAIHPHKLSLLWPGPKEQRWPSVQGKSHKQGNLVQESDAPIPRIGMSHDDGGVPHPYSQVSRPSPTDPAGTCLPLQALHAPIQQISGSTIP